MSYDLRILGTYELVDQGGSLVVRRPVRRLTAFLALRGLDELRSLVAAALWPDLPDHRALANLRSVLWRCHRELPGLIIADERAVTLAPDTTVDYLQRSDPDRWFEDLLPGWDEEWVELPRFLHRQARLQLIEQHARSAAGGGNGYQIEGARVLLRRLLAREPGRRSAQDLLDRLDRATVDIAPRRSGA